MPLRIINSEAEYEQIKADLLKKYNYTLADFGAVVRTVMPALTPPFPALEDLLQTSTYPQRFNKKYYYLRTEKNFIDRLYPASEYYKIAFHSIGEDLYSMNSSIERIFELQMQINAVFAATKEKMPNTGQTSFNIATQVYQLKSDLGNFFFTSRSVLDTVATLMHFLFGPNAANHRSFSKFVEYVVQGKGGIFTAGTDDLKDYFNNHLSWYDKLKDIRDFNTHYKAFDISFYEQSDETIRIYLEDQFEMNDLLTSVRDGILSLFKFMDNYFVQRVNKILAAGL